MGHAVSWGWERRTFASLPCVLCLIAAPTPAAEQPLRFVTGGSLTAAAVDGPRIYAVVGDELLVLRKAGDGAALDGRVPVRGLCFGLAPAEVAGRRLVVAAIYSEGVQVLDVTDPTAPRETGFAPWPASIHAVAVRGAYAYACCYERLVRAFALDPSGAVRQVGEVKTKGSVTALAVGASAAYVMVPKEGLVPLDLTDPASPQTGTALAADGRPIFNLVLNDALQVALVLTSTGDLLIADTREPLHPEWRGRAHLPIKVQDYGRIVVRGRTALVVGPEAMVTIDLADLNAPTVGQPVPTRQSDIRVAQLDGETLLFADGIAGLRFLDAARLDQPRDVGRFAVPGGVTSVAVVGGRAYAGRASREVELLPPTADLVAATEKATRSAVQLPVIPGGLAAVGRYLAVVTADARVQVHDPATWDAAAVARPVADLALPAKVQGWASGGAILAVAMGSEGLVAVDLSQPERPILSAPCKLDRPVGQVAVAGKRVYAGTARGVVVLRLQEGRLIETGHLDTPAPVQELAAGDDLLFVSTRPSGLLVCDLTKPDAPVILGQAAIPGASSPPLLVGHHLLMGTTDGDKVELVDVDVSDVLAPQVVQRWKLFSAAAALCRLDERHVLVAVFSSGVAVATVAK